MKIALFVAAATLALGAVGAAQAQINAAVEFDTAQNLSDSRAFTLGYQFELRDTVTLNALGYEDDGLGNNHGVGIWDTSGNLIVSTTVQGNDMAVGHFRWGGIADTVLSAGTYVIGGEYRGNNDPFFSQATGVVNIPLYTWDHDLQVLGQGLNFPTTNTGGGYGANGILVADFSIKSGNANAVPEPATWGLMLVGFGGMGALLRNSRRRAGLVATA